MKKKPWDESTKRMMARVSSTPVSKEEILEFVEESALLDSEDRCYEGHLVTLIRLQDGDRDKVSAIMFRMEALALLLSQEGAVGWTLPMPDGGILTSEPVFAAAAVQPLIEQDGEVTFEREAFLEKVLELADVATIG